MSQKPDSINMLKKSDYLLTILLNTSYFCRVNPNLIIAYLIPFVDGNNRPYGASPKELARKLENISHDLHGVSKNYASQGFSFGGLYQPDISFPYYYRQLGLLDKFINESCPHPLNGAEEDAVDLESQYLYSVLTVMLTKPVLYFKKNHEIYEDDKRVMLKHLRRYGNRYVLAELLYYITSQTHSLPHVQQQFLSSLQGHISKNLLEDSNVSVRLRYHFRENAEDIRHALSQAKEFRLMCFSGSSFLDSTGLTDACSFFPLLMERLERDEPINMEIIVNEPQSAASNEFSRFKVAPYHIHISKERMTDNSVKGIQTLMKLYRGKVYAKTTRLYLPYSVCIFRFYNSGQDYAKIDLYSPYILNNDQRPSMIVFRRMEPELFSHFENVFQSVWNDEASTTFIN